MDKFYSKNADKLIAQYNKISTHEAHQDWLHLIPEEKLLILDVGAGSGRDAYWFAEKGYEVIAVEPVDEFRTLAQQMKHNPSVRWINDSLPSLKEVYELDYKYDLILLSGVWNHIATSDRERTFRKLANLLKPGGKLVITLRHGPSSDERVYYEGSTEELRNFAKRFMLELVLEKDSPDRLGRHDVSWTTLVFFLPDDGTHALPLLRHVIINDAKSSTYKLALLRVLLRIADGARGMVLHKDKDYVTIPFGLVALFWTRIYKTLVLDKDFRQQPQRRLGFVREPFRNLRDISPYDLRIGGRFKGENATNLIRALRDVRNIIKKMPVFYTTFPNSNTPIFQCDTPIVRASDSVRLDLEFFSRFGTFKIPRSIWDCLSRYACWVEPAIIKEWCNLMSGYDATDGKRRSLDEYIQSLSWLDAERDTNEARTIAENLKIKGVRLYCVWSGRHISDNYAIDHCFPYIYWPNNDLWNLLPAHPRINIIKSSKIPTGLLLENARERIFEWWFKAYGSSPYEDRFFIEATAALPIFSDMKNQDQYDCVFLGIQNQRLKLKIDQQLQEWDGV